jgi:hypothetical protein
LLKNDYLEVIYIQDMYIALLDNVKIFFTLFSKDFILFYIIFKFKIYDIVYKMGVLIEKKRKNKLNLLQLNYFNLLKIIQLVK